MALRPRWRTSRTARKAYACITLGFVCLAAFVALYDHVAPIAPVPISGGRVLLDDHNSTCHDEENHVTIVPGLDGQCSSAWETSTGGLWASLVYLVIVAYLFLGIAIICDNQFTDSLEMICSEYGLNLSEDVAGATFMAAGSSAPELATSFVGVFIAKNEVGLGTILGSAVFNILIIIGATAILVGQDLQLDWRPVVRDNFFYATSVVLLCVLVLDSYVDWYDALILLLWYLCYLGFMAINRWVWAKVGFPYVDDDADSVHSESDEGASISIEGDDHVQLPVRELRHGSVVIVGEGPGNASHNTAGTGTSSGSSGGSLPGSPTGASAGRSEVVSVIDVDVVQGKPVPAMGSAKLEDVEEVIELKPKRKKQASFSTGMWRHEDDDEEDEERSCVDCVLEVLSWPWEVAFNYTMPDCHLETLDAADDDDALKIASMQDQIDECADPTEKAELERQLRALTEPEYEDLSCGQRWYMATFFISLLWLTVISYLMVEFILKLGCLWSISAVVMGLTFLAMGTSIPDALGSIAVARDGEGDMAVSNAVGSNVFDICLGLGLPWFIQTAIVSPGSQMHIGDTDAVVPSIIILLGIIVILFGTFAAAKWTLKSWVGYVLFATYIAFLIYQIVRAKVMNDGC